MMNEDTRRTIRLPHMGIVLLAGPSNSGKTTLLDRLVEEGVLAQSEVISSDQFRILVADEGYIDWRNRPKLEADILYDDYQRISEQAFAAMDVILHSRCRLGKLTVVDATHLYPEDRQKYVEMADKLDVPAVVIGLDVPEEELLRRDRQRREPRGKQRIKQQAHQFKRTVRGLREEGFASCYVLKDAQLSAVRFERRHNPLYVEIGAGIDVIGDIHGCWDEMMGLIAKLGYAPDAQGLYRHPDGRKLVSVGDVMSRGPQSLRTLSFWQQHVEAGAAYMVDSNHGWKIGRYLEGRSVTLSHGDELVAEELAALTAQIGIEAADRWKQQMSQFLLAAPSHLVWGRDGIRHLVVAHAGIRDEAIGKQSKRISDFCRYGDVDGFQESGKPVRKDWYADHRSAELIVWGHDPRFQPAMVNGTVNIDQGVVFGGELTAFRYPERAFVSVQAVRDYAQVPDNPLQELMRRRFAPPNSKRLLEGFSVLTDSYGEIEAKGEYVKAAFDTISHYTVPIEELLYVPPTMSPPAVSSKDQYLEHPREAFAYYRAQGVQTMIAQKKHMGSRAVLTIYREEQDAVPYIGYPSQGSIYTRTGRSFFPAVTEAEVLSRLRQALAAAGYFERYKTDLVVLDAEILPWNLKARELIATQYAHVAEAAMMDRTKLAASLRGAQAAGCDVAAWVEEAETKLQHAHTFRQAFQAYCWDVQSLADIRIAPFHILAHSGSTHFDKAHEWHMAHARELAECSPLFMETEYRVITDEASEEEAIVWWSELTEAGHEGIVVKPEYMVMRNGHKLIQPAIKVRGRSYLHIIYGMDYLDPANLKRLKQRKTRKKERHALMEFALSMESLDRFIRKESVERMHECVLASIALESDPVDPRL